MRTMTTELVKPHDDTSHNYYTYLRYVTVSIIAVLSVLLSTGPIHAAVGDDIEEGGVESHELFDFEAFINHGEVLDGSGPFDKHEKLRGYDMSDSNGKVRTWDTISYPLRITVNPKKAEMLRDVELEITGTLDNGITDGRANAKFSIGGVEDLENETVSFKQKYTIEQTGSAIMIPVTVEVVGARHGVKLTPDLQVQVVSVDGKDIRKDNVTTEFDGLPGVTTTADVSIKPYVQRGISALGIPWYPIQNITGDPDDMENIHMFAVSWGIEKLTGKPDMKGATFPESDAVLDYDIDLSGSVAWQTGPNEGDETKFNFTGANKDTPFRIFDHRDISGTRTSVGAPNTISDGQSYEFEHIRINYAPYSKMPDYKPETIAKYAPGNVWDSGVWSVDKPTVTKNNVNYKGSNTDFVIGSTFPTHMGYAPKREKAYFNKTDRLFSTQAFVMQMENEYRMADGKKNPDNHGNIVTYNANVTLNGYTDASGHHVDINKKGKPVTFSEINSSKGTYSFYNDFTSYPEGKQLGTYVADMGSLAKGDASTLIGEDVNFRGRLQSNVAFVGGINLMYHWNSDAFGITKEYAAKAEKSIMNAGYEAYTQNPVRNDTVNHSVSYGVKKFKSNEFETIRRAHHTDYTWYDTFDAANKAGEVSGILSTVKAGVGASRYPQVSIPLKVKHNNIGIGATSSDNAKDANIAVLSSYGYMDKTRTMEVDISGTVTMGNPAIWNSSGIMEKIQSPRSSYANFETLAVTPAEVSTELDTDKDTYYNSESIEWISESGVDLPESGTPTELDAGVTLRHELPEGLDYVAGSGRVDGEPIEPEITRGSKDADRELIWDVMISNADNSIPDVEFETTINQKAVGSGAQSSATIKSVIESDFDKRPERFRTSSKSVTITKIGMVGVHETIAETHGPKNSEYVVTMTPYTTIDSEAGVVGATTIPYVGDPSGSEYTGSVELSGLDIKLNRDASINKDDITLYLNRNVVHAEFPQDINLKSGGWYKYTGKASELKGALSVLFTIDDVITNSDVIDINMTIQTKNNNFGDTYMNETVVNSDTNYTLSPVSNKVRYTIRPDLELSLERFQIYTDRAAVGLPTFTRVLQATPYGPAKAKDLKMTLGIYNTETGDKVASKSYNQPDIKNENAVTIPKDTLEAGNVSNYEVRIEGYDENRVWVKDGTGSINTDGHVSEEGTLTEDDINPDTGLIEFDGVVMTERERGGDMTSFSETLTVDPIDAVESKSGYGFAMDASVSYENPLMSRIEDLITDVAFEIDTSTMMDRNLIDKTLSFYDESENMNRIPMERAIVEDPEIDDIPEAVLNTTRVDYELPQVYLEKNTGLTHTASQVEASDDLSVDTMLDGGHNFYIPVWIDTLGIYDTVFTSDRGVGSHFMKFEVVTPVDVTAFMLHHIDSESPDDDELLIRPVERDELPEFWNQDEE